MKILRIHPFMKSERIAPQTGGMARVALLLTKALIRAGHEVVVLPVPEMLGTGCRWGLEPDLAVPVAPTLEWPSLSEWVPVMARLPRLRPLPARGQHLVYDWMALAALRRILRSFRPDVIHNHLARAPFPRLVDAMPPGAPTVLSHHHFEAGERVARYDRVVFVSEGARNRILPDLPYSRGRTRVVHNPIPPEFLSGEVPGDDERHGVAYVGTINQRKGLDLLIGAYREDSTLARLPLAVFGAEEEPRFRAEAEREKLPFEFHGQVPHAELARRLRAARIMVLPSRKEAFSSAYIQSVCSGTPVIGWAEQIREMETLLGMPVGIPFDGNTQTARELADAIRELESGGMMRGDYRRKLAAAAVERFSLDRFLNGYLQVYRELVS